MTSSATRGVLASSAASVLFGVLFFLPSMLQPLDANPIFAWRLAVTIPIVTLLYAVVGQWPDICAIARRLLRRPRLIAALALAAALLAPQLWLFGWAPRSGRGLEVALGYLLMPLVMVVIGAVLHREHLSRMRIAAVSTATLGVVAAVLIAGGIGWPTLLVAVGYPVYFVVRRRTGLDRPGALLFELTLMLPVAVWILAQPGGMLPISAPTPPLVIGVLLLGLVGGTALTLFLAASRILPFALFGLLGYLEPILLVIVAVLFLHEPLTLGDVSAYGPIVIALALLGIDSVVASRSRSASPSQPLLPVHNTSGSRAA